VAKGSDAAEARRQRGEATFVGDGQVVALLRRPRHTSAEVVLLRIPRC
jgi:hypothetical protein